MALLQLCDLCGCKVKDNKADLNITGQIQLHDGRLPNLPEGMRYREDDEEIGLKYIKVWNSFGKVIKETKLVEKPPKRKKVKINYELCETCLNKLVNMLENLRQHYHLESKEIEILENNSHNLWENFIGYEE